MLRARRSRVSSCFDASHFLSICCARFNVLFLSMNSAELQAISKANHLAVEARCQNLLGGNTPERPLRCLQQVIHRFQRSKIKLSACSARPDGAPIPSITDGSNSSSALWVPTHSGCRSTEHSLLLAQDVVNHEAVSKALPYLVAEHTSATGSSCVALADGLGSFAVLAIKHVPEGTHSSFEECRIEEAKWVAEQRAQKMQEEGLAVQPGSRMAVGVVSNSRGLEWVTPPSPSKLQALLPKAVSTSAAAAVGDGSMVVAAGTRRGFVRRVLRGAGALLAGCTTAVAVFAVLVAAKNS